MVEAKVITLMQLEVMEKVYDTYYLPSNPSVYLMRRAGIINCNCTI
jgi:hypothetical protein